MHISYRVKLISVYHDTYLPLQTQTMGDLQGQYCKIASFRVASYPYENVYSEGMDVSCVYGIYKMYRDTIASQSHIVTLLVCGVKLIQ